MKKSILPFKILQLLLIFLIGSTTSFTISTTSTHKISAAFRPETKSQRTELQMLLSPYDVTSLIASSHSSPNPETFLASTYSAASSFLLATVSADIDRISNDDFGLVFAGGIGVMVGGVVSALIVGFLLENSNSYANVVADSYAQGGDEAFWESLSPEDKVKTQEMLNKIRKSKGLKMDENKSATDGSTTSKSSDSLNVPIMNTSSEKAEYTKSTRESNGKTKELSLFSDYDD